MLWDVNTFCIICVYVSHSPACLPGRQDSCATKILLHDGRRLGHVNVLYVIEIACVGRKEGKKRGNEDWVRDPNVGQLTMSVGLVWAEVCSYVQRATIPSKRVIYTLNICKVPYKQ